MDDLCYSRQCLSEVQDQSVDGSLIRPRDQERWPIQNRCHILRTYEQVMHTPSDGNKVRVHSVPDGHCSDVVPSQVLRQFEGQDLRSVVGISRRQHLQQRLFVVRRNLAVFQRLCEGRDVDGRSLTVPSKHKTGDVTQGDPSDADVKFRIRKEQSFLGTTTPDT